jgi:metal-sulfur cluster biosynthetic enzyme
MLSEADIVAALRDCFDPETKLNLVDLGLIYKIETAPDPDSKPAWPRQRVKVTMTLNNPDSPAGGLVVEQVQNRLAGIADISRVEVSLVWEPQWSPDESASPAAGNSLNKISDLSGQRPPQSLAFDGNFVDRILHLDDDLLHLVNVAWQRSPPGAQRVLLVEHRQRSSGGRGDYTGPPFAREQQQTGRHQASTCGKSDPVCGFALGNFRRQSGLVGWL